MLRMLSRAARHFQVLKCSINWQWYHKLNIFTFTACVDFTLLWRKLSIWNHRQRDNLANSLFRPSSKDNIKAPHHCCFLKGIHRWSVDSPYKETVVQEASPHHAIIIARSAYTAGTCFMMSTINNSVYSEAVFVYLARGPGAWYHIWIATTIERYPRATDRWPLHSPYKIPAMQKSFPCYDVTKARNPPNRRICAVWASNGETTGMILNHHAVSYSS